MGFVPLGHRITYSYQRGYATNPMGTNSFIRKYLHDAFLSFFWFCFAFFQQKITLSCVFVTGSNVRTRGKDSFQWWRGVLYALIVFILQSSPAFKSFERDTRWQPSGMGETERVCNCVRVIVCEKRGGECDGEQERDVVSPKTNGLVVLSVDLSVFHLPCHNATVCVRACVCVWVRVCYKLCHSDAGKKRKTPKSVLKLTHLHTHFQFEWVLFLPSHPSFSLMVSFGLFVFKGPHTHKHIYNLTHPNDLHMCM